MAPTTDDTASILVNELYGAGSARSPIVHKQFSDDGAFCETWTFEPSDSHVACHFLSTLSGRKGEEARFKVAVDWQPCNRGGVRPYLWCPRCHTRSGHQLAGVDEVRACATDVAGDVSSDVRWTRSRLLR